MGRSERTDHGAIDKRRAGQVNDDRASGIGHDSSCSGRLACVDYRRADRGTRAASGAATRRSVPRTCPTTRVEPLARPPRRRHANRSNVSASLVRSRRRINIIATVGIPAVGAAKTSTGSVRGRFTTLRDAHSTRAVRPTHCWANWVLAKDSNRGPCCPPTEPIALDDPSRRGSAGCSRSPGRTSTPISRFGAAAPMAEVVSLGDRLKTRRAQLGLSQAQAAASWTSPAPPTGSGRWRRRSRRPTAGG